MSGFSESFGDIKKDISNFKYLYIFRVLDKS